MIATLFQAVVAFFFTFVAGSRIAHAWQVRAAKENRFFEASKDMYAQMMKAADDLSQLIGKRLYASQRVCMLGRDSPDFETALGSYRNSVVEWNERLLSLELAVRTRFRDASLSEFESLQSHLAETTRLIESSLISQAKSDRRRALYELRLVRGRFFQFTQAMVKEARLLHRQMHFGVIVQYDATEIDRMSTQNLIKSLFTSRVEGQAIVRSPSDFGLPVGVRDARFGIYE